MRADYKSLSYGVNRFDTVIEVCNYPTMNMVVNIPRISKAEFLNNEEKKKEEFIKGYWKIKKLK